MTETIDANNKLRAEIARYQTKQRELDEASQTLKDEHQALQLAFASLEDKLRKTQVIECKNKRTCNKFSYCNKAYIVHINSQMNST